MVARFPGALVRAVMVLFVFVLPSLLLPTATDDLSLLIALVALFAAGLTFFEYASAYPGLIEFRFAPPYNRIRFVSLLIMVLLLSVCVLSRVQPTTLARFIDALGAVIARSIDLPYSPVRLLVLMLPAGAPAGQVDLVRTAGGVAYMTSLLTLAWFVIAIRIQQWPLGRGTFNVWVNMPTFDPTGGDVVRRLYRDAWVNTILGFLLPFLIPAMVKIVSVWLSPVTFASPLTLIWMVSAWAFLPASLFMRGIALGRVAHMIEERRRATLHLEALQHA